MYKVKNIVYSDAGKLLTSDKFVGYSHPGLIKDFKETKINLSSAVFENNIINFNNGLVQIYINNENKNYNYGDWKGHLVKTRYSNDDQIAIILNKDTGNEDDLVRYNKMQDWRIWCGELANKILEILNINNS